MPSAVSQASFRLLQKFGDPKITKNLQFSEFFCSDIVPGLIDSHLGIIHGVQSGFVGRKCLFYSVQFVNSVVKNPYTVAHIKDNLQPLLFQCTLPLFVMGIDEFEAFSSDHAEYLDMALDLSSSHSKSVK